MISVIIPCFNQGRYLQSALDSVLVQVHTEWEVLVVNDASTDETQDVAEATIKENPEKRIGLLTSDSNEGLSKSRNEAIARSSGEYILPLDADDFLHPMCLKLMVQQLDDNKADIVSANRMNFGMSCGLVATDSPNLALLPLRNPIGYCSMFRRSVWEQAGGYTDNAGREGYEDWEFWIKCALQKFRFMNVPQPLWFYRVRSDSMAMHAMLDDDYLMARLITRYSQLYDQSSISRAFAIVEAQETDKI